MVAACRCPSVRGLLWGLMPDGAKRQSLPCRRECGRVLLRALVIGVLCLPIGVAGCGGQGQKATSGSAQPQAQAPAQLRAAPLPALSAPVQLPAAAPIAADQALIAGGLDAHSASRANIDALVGGHESARGRLPTPLHDAAAVSLGDAVYYFGGGGGQGGADISSDRILRIDPRTGATSPAGKLPAPSSDVSATVIGDTAYIVGGYTGKQPLNTIVAWRPGAPAQVVSNMPQPLRYAATTAASGRVIIAGGSTPMGTASDAIYSFDPQSRQTRPIGRLPSGVTHAAGATMGTQAFIFGGRGPSSNSQTDAILAIDPVSGQARSAGRLPAPLSDMGAVSLPGKILLIGGRSPKGAEPALTQMTP